MRGRPRPKFRLVKHTMTQNRLDRTGARSERMPTVLKKRAVLIAGAKPSDKLLPPWNCSNIHGVFEQASTLMSTARTNHVASMLPRRPRPIWAAGLQGGGVGRGCSADIYDLKPGGFVTAGERKWKPLAVTRRWAACGRRLRGELSVIVHAQ